MKLHEELFIYIAKTYPDHIVEATSILNNMEPITDELIKLLLRCSKCGKCIFYDNCTNRHFETGDPIKDSIIQECTGYIKECWNNKLKET